MRTTSTAHRVNHDPPPSRHPSVNGGASAVWSTATLGFGGPVQLTDVDEFDRRFGYDYIAGGSQVAGEVGLGLLTGWLGAAGKAGRAATVARGVRAYDVAGNVVTAGRGVADMAQKGAPTVGNVTQVLAGVAGIGGNARVRSANSTGAVFNQGMRASELADPALLRKLEARGYSVNQGPEIVRYLESRGANAGTFLDKDLLLRPDARKLEVLEEYLHNVQHRIGLTDRLTSGPTGGLEVHVKDFMLRHRGMLGLNDADAGWLNNWLEKAAKINAGD